MLTIFGLLAAGLTIRAQPHPSSPEFEAASLRVSETSNALREGGPGTSSPGQWIVRHGNLRYLVMLGWELNSYQIAGPPTIDSAFYDIAAKLPPGTGKKAFHQMIQDLLTARLGLTLRRESRVQDVYEMVVAKGGPRLTPAEPALPGVNRPAGSFDLDRDGTPQMPLGTSGGLFLQYRGALHSMGRMQTLQEMARGFSSAVVAGRPVIDKTGVAGEYDYHVTYQMDAPPSAEALPGDTFPRALERQLGLKLEPKRTAMDVIVIDRFNRVPAEN